MRSRGQRIKRSENFKLKRFTPLEKVHPVRDKSLTGFTLIELMIAASILAIGIVLISRSFLTMVTALDTSSNKIKAVQFLENEMSKLTEEAKREGGITQQQKQDKIVIGNRLGKWELKVELLDLEEELTLQEEIEEQIEKGESINIVEIKVGWEEAHKQRDAVLAAYFLSNESVQDFEF